MTRTNVLYSEAVLRLAHSMLKVLRLAHSMLKSIRCVPSEPRLRSVSPHCRVNDPGALMPLPLGSASPQAVWLRVELSVRPIPCLYVKCLCSGESRVIEVV